VPVQEKPDVADWTQLEVPYREPEVPEDLVRHELELLQNTVAALAPADGRPVQAGDTVVIDIATPSGDNREDYVVDLGSGSVVEEIEQGLLGLAPGESREIEFELGDDTRQTVTATVKEIKEKVLPPVDDDLAKAATEFETAAELRADIEGRLREQIEAEVDTAFRAAVADKLVEASKFQATGPLVDARTRELLTGLARQVERRGVDFETYLAMTGTDPNELIARLQAEAAQSVARELVLEAAADKLDLQVPDEQVETLIREQAEAVGDDPEPLLTGLRENGRFEQLRDDLRLRNALDRIAGEVKRIEPEVAAAREAIWTPDKEKSAKDTKLWTPGSKEPE
jgi:trigger factor